MQYLDKYPNIGSSDRPISLMNCIPKVLENLIKQRLEYHLEQNNLLPKVINSFRRGRGTVDNLTVLATDIYSAFTEGKVLIAVFIDEMKTAIRLMMAAAYDDVDLEEFKNNLIDCGVNTDLIHTILQLLWGRSKSVRGRNGEGYGTHVTYTGLLQGSSLSPLLFNVHSRSIFKI